MPRLWKASHSCPSHEGALDVLLALKENCYERVGVHILLRGSGIFRLNHMKSFQDAIYGFWTPLAKHCPGACLCEHS